MDRAIVEERDYAVAARVRATDGAGEKLPKSERLLIAFEIERRCGREVQIVEEGGDYSVVAELGDAPERAFEEAAGALMEASSW